MNVKLLGEDGKVFHNTNADRVIIQPQNGEEIARLANTGEIWDIWSDSCEGYENADIAGKQGD